MYSYQPLCASQKEITKSQSSRAVVQKNSLENFGKSPARFPKLTFTCSKSIIKTMEKGIRYVQS